MAGIEQIAGVAASAVTHPVDVTHFIGNNTGSSYALAQFIMKIVDWILGVFGLEHNNTLVTFLYAAVVFGVAIVVGRITQVIVLGGVHAFARRWNSQTYKALTSVRFFHKLCRVIPAIVFLILIQFTLSNHDALSTTLTKLTLIYVVYVTCIALSALIGGVWEHIDARENKRKLPLKGLAQLAKGIVWIVAAIVVIAILVDKSPAALLAGLGAFATVLMLIFKDSILGLVAGVQLSENDSLHVGDWIKVDGTDANGTVLEVTLTSVKVLNWDKTTTTLPPYSLVSGSFTNYRSMQESNTRRICRSYMIDADSVLPTTPQMLDNIRKVPFMDEYISKKLAQKEAGKVADVDNPDGLVDGTIDTNLGLFRAYMKMWLLRVDSRSDADRYSVPGVLLHCDLCMALLRGYSGYRIRGRRLDAALLSALYLRKSFGTRYRGRRLFKPRRRHRCGVRHPVPVLPVGRRSRRPCFESPGAAAGAKERAFAVRRQA